MRLGLVLTIRNERALLRRNLLFHRFVGVDKVYLYLDHCTDGSAHTIEDLSYVQVALTTDREMFRGRPGAEAYVDNYHNMSARQSLDVIRTLDLAVADGIDWLVHLDADELVCPSADGIGLGDLKRLLDSVGDEVECVRFRPYEVCARRLEYDDVFSEETLFTPPGLKGQREILNPIDGSRFKAGLALGHRRGKVAVRVASGLMPRGPHEFRRLDESRPTTVRRGLLLHFFLYSFSQFIQKFRNMADRPDTWIHGKLIRPQKRLWRDMVNSGDFDEDELRAYFKRWVMVTEHEVSRRRREIRLMGIRLVKPTLVEVTAASRAFLAIKDRPEGA